MSNVADLSKYVTQFDELRTEERTTTIDVNAIFPLSKLRSEWGGSVANIYLHAKEKW
jgi:hypothetical protein